MNSISGSKHEHLKASMEELKLLLQETHLTDTSSTCIDLEQKKEQLKLLFEQYEITVLNKIDAEYAIKAEEWRAKHENLKQAQYEASIKAIRKQRLKKHLNIGILIAVIAAIILCAYFTPTTERDWSAIIGPIFMCVLMIGYVLMGKS